MLGLDKPPADLNPQAVQLRSPTPALLLGLLATLLAAAVYAAYTVRQINLVQGLQQDMIDRNRKDSLQLLRIQNDLGALSLAMRDILDQTEPYPLTAWSAQFDRLRRDLDESTRLEASLALERTPQQAEYLADSMRRFWGSVDSMFAAAREGRDDEARHGITDTIQARLSALTAVVARSLVQNYESDQRVAARMGEIYSRVKRNVYLLLAAMLCFMVLIGLVLIASNFRLFQKITDLMLRLRPASGSGIIPAPSEPNIFPRRWAPDARSSTTTEMGGPISCFSTAWIGRDTGSGARPCVSTRTIATAHSRTLPRPPAWTSKFTGWA